MRTRGAAALAVACLASVGRAGAEAPAVPSNPLRNAYFGETHMHTAYSLDAYLGGTRLLPLLPSDAYRLARGQAVIVDGTTHQRKRPLDFVAVTDHAEYMGEMYSTVVEGAPGHDHELLEQLRTMTDLEDRQKWFLKYVVSSNRSATPQHPPFFAGPETVRNDLPLLEDVPPTIQERAWTSPIWYAP